MKILSGGAEVFYLDGRTDGHDEDNSSFLQFLRARTKEASCPLWDQSFCAGHGIKRKNYVGHTNALLWRNTDRLNAVVFGTAGFHLTNVNIQFP